MREEKFYAEYPWWIVIVANLHTISMYAVGASLIGHFGRLYLLLYLGLCVWVEIKVLRGSCAACCYYGKRCAFGKGLLCSRVLPKKEPNELPSKVVVWKDLLPDFMVVIIPAAAGLFLFIAQFHWSLLFQWLLLLILFSFGNAWIRGSLACPFCLRKKEGCPALELFEKKQ
jgi:hypothetical protein